MDGNKKLSDSTVVPLLTGALAALGTYGYYGNGEVSGINTPLAVGGATALTSFAIEAGTNYGLNSFQYDATATYTQKLKMLAEPAIVGAVGWAVTYNSDYKDISPIGCFAVSAGSNILAKYGSDTFYTKKY